MKDLKLEAGLNNIKDSYTEINDVLSDIGSLDYEVDSKYVALMSRFTRDFGNVLGIVSGLVDGMVFLNNAMNDLSRISTNMNFLSLNAAIESAEAKEKSGRGFEVVAQQIGDLSKGLTTVVEKFNTSGESMLENLKIVKEIIYEFQDLLENLSKSLSVNDRLYSKLGKKIEILLSSTKSIKSNITILEAHLEYHPD